jgi:hypothetical protein
MPPDRTFVIVGVTPAGAKTAPAVAEEGFAGRRVLSGAEHGIPLAGGAAVKRGAA